MLRVSGIALGIVIAIYGITELIKLFSKLKLKKKEEKYREARSLAELEEQAKTVAAQKESILGEADRNKEVIDNIKDTLN